LNRERIHEEDLKQFFKLFHESTFEGSQAAARKMKKIARRYNKQTQKWLLFHSLNLLVHSDFKMLSWPNIPLLVLLRFVDPNVLSGDKDEPLQEGVDTDRVTLLHTLANLAAPSDYSTHGNQLILAKQLNEHGANVNAVSSPHNRTPSHMACYTNTVTNLDFVEYLIPTALMYALFYAPSAATFLLNWPTTDANITMRSGESFLFGVTMAVKYFPTKLHSLITPTRSTTTSRSSSGVTSK
jgi:ankyrin repeat protein